MKTNIKYLEFTFVLLFTLCLFMTSISSGAGISGTVKKQNDAGMENVKVVIKCTESNNPGELPGKNGRSIIVITDAKGSYQAEGLSAGKYIVSATYATINLKITKYYDDKTNIFAADTLTIEEDQFLTYIDFYFSLPNSKITGTVTDTAGDPIKNAYIGFVQKSDTTYVSWGRLWQGARTDENGYYELTDLSAGTYFVSAAFWDWKNFKVKWYKNADSLEAADEIVVAGNDSVSDINITLDLASNYGSISGNAQYENGSPVPYALVQAQRIKKKSLDFIKNQPTILTTTDDNGDYKLDHLLEGEYFVKIRKDGYEEYFDDKTAEKADTITVIAGITTNEINFVLPAPAQENSQISGTVFDESSDLPLAGALVAVFPSFTSNPIKNTSRWLKVYFTSLTDENGQFHIKEIPLGSYVVSAWSRGYLGEFYDNVRNPRNAFIFELEGTNHITGINIALTPRAGFELTDILATDELGTISGKIQTKDGLNVESAFIFALDQNENLAACELSGPDGDYAIEGLSIGSYFLLASRMPFNSTFFPNANDITTAEPILIDNNTTKNVQDINFLLSVDYNTKTEESQHKPTGYILYQNFPNPFNPVTVIEYQIPETSFLELLVYNLHGQLIKTLVSDIQQSSRYAVNWDGTDESGQSVSSGIYFIKLKTKNYTGIKRAIFLR